MSCTHSSVTWPRQSRTWYVELWSRSAVVACWIADFRVVFFFFNDTATTEIYTLSLHDALPISWSQRITHFTEELKFLSESDKDRSEEHTSELQSRFGISYAVFCLKKKTNS